MSETPRNHTVYVARKLNGAEADKTRAEIVRFLSRQIIDGLKAKLDPASWVNAGWSEFEAYVDALCNGGTHPALAEWMTDRANGGRPAPLIRETYGRRLAVLFCESLVRAGMNRRAAQHYAVEELATTGLFGTITPRVIRFWAEKILPLSPEDELLVATGFTTAGGQPQKLALFFICLCHLALNPTAVAVREGCQESGDYIGNNEVG
jgi:hypothetical protein